MDAIRINTSLTKEHIAALTAYLRGEKRLTRNQWRKLRAAIDLLARSSVVVNGVAFTFAGYYDEFIDRQWADSFLQGLLESEDLASQALQLQAATARRIVQFIQQQSFYRKDEPASHWLLIYCLFWWSAFARGYEFEVEIFRDLAESGIEFSCHNLAVRSERLSAFDLTVLRQRGDIKHSDWFLTFDNPQIGEIEFFITQLYEARTARLILVILVKPDVWPLFDGDTQLVEWDNVTDDLRIPAQTRAGGAQFVVVLYEDWKQRVRARQ